MCQYFVQCKTNKDYDGLLDCSWVTILAALSLQIPLSSEMYHMEPLYKETLIWDHMKCPPYFRGSFTHIYLYFYVLIRGVSLFHCNYVVGPGGG